MTKATCALALTCVVSSGWAQTNVTWVGPDNGDWNIASNWSGGFVPTNGFPLGSSYRVHVDGGAGTNVFVGVPSGTSFTINDLFISAGDRVSLEGNSTLQLVGDGSTAVVQGAGRLSTQGTLAFNVSTVAFSGGGSLSIFSFVQSTGAILNQDYEINGSGSLTAIHLNNSGTISDSVRLFPNGNASMVNSGLIRSSGATLTLGSGSYLNSGTILANVGTVALRNLSISGGTLATLGTGRIYADNASVTLANVTNTGQIIASNAGTLTLAGVINNSGSINVQQGNRLRFTGNTLIMTGGGTLNVNGGVLSGSGSLLNDGIIAGGFAGASFVDVAIRNQSQGRILTTTNGLLSIDAPSFPSSFVNQGTISATGGTITLNGTGGGIFDNTLGTIEGPFLQLISNAVLSGGTLNGTVTASPGTQTLVGPMLNTGTILGEPGSTVQINGVITNTGSIVLNSATALFNSSPLNNSGTIIISATSALRGAQLITGGTILLTADSAALGGSGPINNFAVIRGRGSLLGNTGWMVNNSSITADVNVSILTIDPANTGTAFDNRGTLAAANGGLLLLSGNGGGGFLNSSGTIEARVASSIGLANGVNIFGGFIQSIGNGVVAVNPSDSALLAGVVLQANVTVNNASSLSLLSNSINTGTINVAGNARLILNGGSFNSSNGTLIIAAGGTLDTTNAARSHLPTVSLNGTWNHGLNSDTTVKAIRGLGNLRITDSRVNIEAGGGTVGTIRVGSLSIVIGELGTGTLDLTDHDLAIDYTGTSPVAGLRTLIESAYTGGAWAGPGLTSSSAAVAASTSTKTALGYGEATDFFGATPTTFSGVNIDATTAVVRYTLAGDANLDLTVNISDFSLLAANFNASSYWAQGDFNYDAVTNITDFAMLAANFNQTLPADIRRQSIPEPAVVVGATFVTFLLRNRRRAR